MGLEGNAHGPHNELSQLLHAGTKKTHGNAQSGICLRFKLENLASNMSYKHHPFKDKAQTALFKDPVHTAL
jgi:hypothetical protein